MALSGYLVPIACSYVSVATLAEEDGVGCPSAPVAESRASRAWSVADCVPTAGSRPSVTCPATTTASTVTTAAAAMPVNARPLPPLVGGASAGGASPGSGRSSSSVSLSVVSGQSVTEPYGSEGCAAAGARGPVTGPRGPPGAKASTSSVNASR